MEYDLGAHANAMLVECRPFDNICLQYIIDHGNQFKCQGLEDGCGRYAMCEEVVEFCSNLENACWRMLFHDLSSNLVNQGFPIWRWDWCAVCYSFTEIC